MNINYLREFVVLAEELNYSSAAARLFISQSALSRHINLLEAELGGKLLERNTHSVTLTALGSHAMLQFRESIAQYDALLAGNDEASRKIAGNLSLGLLYYGIAEYFSDFLEQFSSKFPNIHLQIGNYHPHVLYEALSRGNPDVGDMIYARALVNDKLVFHRLFPIRVVAMLPEGHPLAARDSVTMGELTREPLIDLQEDPVSSQCTHELVRRCGVAFLNVVYTRHIETVPAAVLQGKGVHITGDRVKRQAYPGIKYVPISDREAFSYHCFVHQIDNPNPLIPLFINEAMRYFKERAGN